MSKAWVPGAGRADVSGVRCVQAKRPRRSLQRNLPCVLRAPLMTRLLHRTLHPPAAPRQALALEFDCDAVVAGVQREAAEALAPLGALRRLASLSLTPESGALTPALAAALAPRLASLSLGAVRNPNPLAAAGALVGLRALSVEFDSPQVNSVWVAPLLALAGGLEELSLAWVTFHARGAALQVGLRLFCLHGRAQARGRPRSSALAGLGGPNALLSPETARLSHAPSDASLLRPHPPLGRPRHPGRPLCRGAAAAAAAAVPVGPRPLAPGRRRPACAGGPVAAFCADSADVAAAARRQRVGAAGEGAEVRRGGARARAARCAPA